MFDKSEPKPTTDEIAMWEPVKPLRIKLRTATVWWKQTYGYDEVSPTEWGVNFTVW